MSEFNRVEFLTSLEHAVVTFDYATNCAAIDAVFEPFFKLPAAEQAAIGKSLEELSYEEYLRRVALKEGIAGAEKHIEKHAHSATRYTENPFLYAPYTPDGVYDFADMQALVPIRRNVEKLLGAKASPLTKAFNRAAAKLTPEEIVSPAVYTKPMLAVLKVIAKQEGLRKKPGAPKQ